MDPQFFYFQASPARQFPRARIDLHYSIAASCLACRRPLGQEIVQDSYEWTCERGSTYPDVIGESGRQSLLLSERAVADLHDAGVHFGTRPTTIGLVLAPKFHRSKAPPYFLPLLKPGIRVDREASGIGSGPLLCPVCGTEGEFDRARYPDSRRQRLGLHIIPESWNGSHLFLCADQGVSRGFFCTRKVLEVARERRWVGARFDPMDAPHDLVWSWNGIKFKDGRWPPKEWYPPPPDAGKTPQEWIAQHVAVASRTPPFRSGFVYPQPEGVVINRAIRWIGAPALPLLRPLLDHPSQNVRKMTAALTEWITQQDHIQLPPVHHAAVLTVTSEPKEGDQLTPEQYDELVSRALEAEEREDARKPPKPDKPRRRR